MELKSETGAKAAWKGFSSQTVYIAYRLMVLKEEYEIIPEEVEDLMVMFKNDITELVQVKNLSSDLSLSNLKPQEQDSFFRRALRFYKRDITIKIVSFGKIGRELKGLNNGEEKYVRIFYEKMKLHNYSEQEIQWIIGHLKIEKIDEEHLQELIYEIFEKDFKSSIASDIIFENLINYIATLSRKKGKTSRKVWDEKVDNIIKDILSIKGMYEQYGRTIINLKDYKSKKEYHELEKEYRNGIDANPDHIRNNLDIFREKWMNEIEESFNNNNIVIIKGASGQGKSTLAYRYLIEKYSENFVFVVEHVRDLKQAEDILLAIKGLSGTKNGDSIIYIDIAPYDTNWKWIVEQVENLNMDIKILITIREEDFRRTNFDFLKVPIKEIELKLEKEEAEKIYDIYETNKFIDFEDAWNEFGKKGPFMEFIYLLNENQTLKTKLQNQIDNIIEKEVDADNWLKFLLIISYIGQENLRLNLEKVKEVVKSSNMSKMLKNMQEEYLIKLSKDCVITSTHAVRAKLLVEIIMEKIFYKESELLIDSLKCCIDYSQIILVKYFYANFENIDEVTKSINESNIENWTTIASILNSLLWLDVYRLYNENIEEINKGNEITNWTFIPLVLGDITGYFKDNNRIKNIENFAEINPNFLKIKKEVDFEKINLDYKYTDAFLKKILILIKNKKITREDNLSEIGFILFWLSNRSLYLNNIDFVNINIENLHETLDFMVGLQSQKLKEEYNLVLKIIKPIVINRYNMVVFEEKDEEIDVKFINKLEESSNRSFNSRTMEIVNVLRKMYFDKKKYNVKMLGTKFYEGLEVFDTEKHIEPKNIPFEWVTNLNGWLLGIDDYKKRKKDWTEYKREMDDLNIHIFEFLQRYTKGLDYFYRSNGDIKKINDIKLKELIFFIYEKSKNMNKAPQCTVNAYGIKNNFNNEKNKDESDSEEEKNKIVKTIENLYYEFLEYFKNFLNQKDLAILAKVKKKEDRIMNLSVFNIMKALENFLEYKKEYEKRYNKEESIEDIFEELKVLSLLWEMFIKEDFRKQKNRLYDIKLLKKKKEKELEAYISENLEQIKVENENYKNILLEVNVLEWDDVYNKIYENYKEMFPSADLYNYDGFLLKELEENKRRNISIIKM